MKNTTKLLVFFLTFIGGFLNTNSVFSQVHDHSREHTAEEIRAEYVSDSIATIELLERTKREYNMSRDYNKAINCATDNYDFENGSTSGWTTTNNVQMMSGGGNDPYGLFPVVYPGGGGFSVKLGSDQGNFQGRLSRVIAVPASGQSVLSFHFAMCIFNYPHSAADAAKFSVKFYNQSNQLLACPQYECYYASPGGAVGVPNMQQTANVATFYNPTAQGAGSYNVTWSGWTDVTVDLSGYAGQNITAVFDNKYCAYTPDWCYAYVDIDCPTAAPQDVTECMNIPGIISGPPSNGTYRWYNSAGTIIGNSQNQQINTAGNYTLGITPLGSCGGASEVLYNYTINQSPTASFTAPPVCQENNSVFTNTSTTLNSAIWDFGDGGNSVTSSPSHLYANGGSYPVTLTVTSPEGCVDDSIQQVIVHPKPTADFTAPNNCLGIATPFTNNSAVTTGNITAWSWSNANTVFSTLQSPSNTFPTFGGYPVELIVTTNNGCKDTVENTVTIYPNPVANFTAANVCDLQTAAFTNTSTIPGGGVINTWAWTFGDNATANTQNTTHLFAAENNYLNKLVVTSTNGCKDSITKNIAIWPLPQVNFTVPNVCYELGSVFANTSIISSANTPNTIPNYSWNFGDGGTATATNPTHYYAASGDYTIKLIATSANGCKDSLSVLSTVYPKPIAIFSVAPVCAGTQNSFIDASTIGAPDNITNWNWTFGDNATSTAQNPTHLFATENVYSNQLIVTTNNGCKDTVSNNAISWPLPIVNFTVPNICYENASVFANTTTISSANTPNTNAIWNWSFGDGSTSTLLSPSHSYAAAGNYTIKLIATSGNGCIDSISQLTTVYPKPNADFSVAPVCFGINSAFVDNSTVGAPDNITNWNWTFGDNTTSTLQNPTHIFPTENVLSNQLIITTNNGCKDTFNINNTVWPLPQVNFNVTAECLNFANVFTNNSSISNAHTTNSIVQWNYTFGDGATANTANTTHMYANDGVYNAQLVLTSNHGCKDSIQHPVTVYPKPNAAFTGINLSGCSPICPEMNSTSTINAPGVNTTFNWVYSDGFSDAGTSSARCFENPTDATQTYGLTLYVTSDKGCKDTATDPSYINVYHLPIATFDFSPTAPSLIDLTVAFENLSLYANSYAWNIGNLENSIEFEPTFTFPFEPTTYNVQLIASTVHNCTDTAVRTVVIKDVVLIHVPNTFTPNGDGMNSVFKPVVAAGVDPYTFTMLIFNRWGEMVFETHDFDIGWNGMYGNSTAQTGTYTWKIEYRNRANGERKEIHGHVNLIK